MLTTDIPGHKARRLAGLLVLNTCVAVAVGLGVANVMKPGTWTSFEAPQQLDAETAAEQRSPVELPVENIPRSIVGPLGDKQNIIGVIFIAVAFGIAMRNVKGRSVNNVTDIIEIAHETLLTVIHWIIHLVPLGVFCIVAKVVGTEGFDVVQRLMSWATSMLAASWTVDIRQTERTTMIKRSAQMLLAAYVVLTTHISAAVSFVVA